LTVPARLACAPALRNVIAFGIGIAIFVARRPDIITNPQLWAEDGRVWFQDAYNLGAIPALWLTHTGYFQTFARLVFGIGLLFPIDYVPLWANAVALIFRGVPLVFLFSRRFHWIDWRVKIILAVYYCLMPNLSEVHANITNTQTYLGIYLLLLILADRPASRLAVVHDVIALMLCGLSCPIIVFIVPCWLLKETADLFGTSFTWQHAVPRLLAPFPLVMFAVAAIQTAVFLLHGGSSRPRVPTGSTMTLLVEILDSWLFAGFVLPHQWRSVFSNPFISLAIFIPAVVILLAVLIRGDWRARSIILFSVIVLAATLKNPVISNTEPSWPFFLRGAGERYFVIPNLCWFGVLLYFVVLHFPRANPIVLGVSIPAMILALLPSFRMSPIPDVGFYRSVERFKAAKKADHVVIPIAPPGWHMTLIKK
jgi:hypothetical protein